MITIITSTINPEAYSYFSVEDRYLQTIYTIKTLREKGFKEIYLLDNSPYSLDSDKIKNDTFQDLKIIHIPLYCFKSKGLNEALLILNSLSKIPENEYIFKISGRYYPTEEFSITKLMRNIDDKEILGVCPNIEQKMPFFSTRSYVIKNKNILESILVLVIDEMIAYGRATNSLRGIVKLVKSIFTFSVGTPFKLSLEHSFGRIIKHKMNYALSEAMNIEGYVAGSSSVEFISE